MLQQFGLILGAGICETVKLDLKTKVFTDDFEYCVMFYLAEL